MGFSSSSVGYHGIRNQSFIWFGFWEKVEYWGLKNENPCFKNFSGVLSSWFRLGGGEESQGFSEVKNSKFENGFLTMSSLDHKISTTIFSFAIKWVEIKIFQFWDIGWKLKSHSWSSEKSQNGIFLITYSHLLESIATYGIKFGWV